ncbi:MAG: ABC transporter ATP-binding protein [Elusimicrobiota bacterium]
MISIKGLSKSYGQVDALENLDLEIADGEIFAFLGPNGAGKTTTVKLLCGLLTPDSGTITFNGVDLAQHPEEAKRLIGLVPDEPYIYPKLTAWEFLELVASIYGLDAEWRLSARHYIELFELAGAVDGRVLMESFSHGMRQKVVFISSLMRGPKVWLLDEPLVGLDPKSMRFIKDLILERARQGASVFLSTHVLSIAEVLANRIGIIQQGKVIFMGTQAELKDFLRARDMTLRESDTLEDLFLKATLR